MFQRLQCWLRRLKYREGRTISRIIARDVRRDIIVLSASRLDEGIITGRVRTTNVLYVAKRLVPRPDFGPPENLHIKQMWKWTGKPWGGLPDGSSIADHLRKK